MNLQHKNPPLFSNPSEGRPGLLEAREEACIAPRCRGRGRLPLPREHLRPQVLKPVGWWEHTGGRDARGGTGRYPQFVVDNFPKLTHNYKFCARRALKNYFLVDNFIKTSMSVA